MASIRRTLLVWYGAMLAVTLGAFGTLVYFELRRSMFAEVDPEIRALAETIAGGIRLAPDGRFELQLSDENHALFETNRFHYYYVVYAGSGPVSSRPDWPGPARPEAPCVREREGWREIAVAGPPGVVVLVGRRLQYPMNRIRGIMVGVVAGGAIILLVALQGGSWLAARTLVPIARMTETAAAVATDLSKRIDERAAAEELAALARTLNEAFARLEAAFERQTRFTADASHELRTPLSIVMTQIELALRKERTPAEYRETLETCLRAAHRMKGVIEGLLTLARADAKDVNLAREKVDLRAVVEETVAMLRPMAAERNVTLSVTTEPAEVVGDRDRLREVVTNLVTNAIRYNRDNGTVEVALRGGVLTVRDTGLGIPEKDRPHVFERFYRADKARSRELGGTGLGLAIAKWIVEAHGGSIAFESREGEGTTFTVRFS